MRFRKPATAAAAAAALVALPMALPAAAAPTVSAPLVEGLVGPLGLGVRADGTVYASQSFAEPSVITAVGKKGSTRTVVTDPSGSVNGISTDPFGSLTYVVSAHHDDGDFTGFVKQVGPHGKTRTLADVAAFEKKHNPDKVNLYGPQGLSPECAAQFPAELGGGDPYPGQLDSNAYAVTRLGPWRYVADAGGNDILRVSPSGKVSVVAVLPPVPVTITKDIIAKFGLPSCVKGKTYNFEPVPTDVEVGPGGMLYVTSLPGGPEDGSFGAIGGVFRVNPYTGSVKRIATGLVTATDLAVTPRGTIYVTELFGDRVSKIVAGRVHKVVDLPQPSAIEYAKGKLYVTQNALGPNGSVVTLTP